VSGAVAATIGIFLPSFLLVIGVAPWFARLQARPRFRHALTGATLSFVGLLAAVTLRLGSAVPWTVPRAPVVIAAFLALRAGVSLPWLIAGALAIGASGVLG